MGWKMKRMLLVLVVGLLAVSGCAGGAPQDSDNFYVVGGNGNDQTHVGDWSGPQGEGVCDFFPEINVRKNAHEVVVGGRLVCATLGNPPTTCGFQVDALYNIQTRYSHFNARDTCAPGGPLTTSHYGCGACTGDWDGEGGVYVTAPAGSTWTPRSGCTTSGATIDCDFSWDGAYVS